MAKLIDLTGKRFERLVVLRRSRRNTNAGQPIWVCACDCGGNVEVMGQNLRRGLTKSCGCLNDKLKRERKTSLRHGESLTPEYRAWLSMKTRCTNSNSVGWADYGGRGIMVCDRWLNSYEDFLADVGRRPSPEHSLDRYPNNDGNYEKGNCRWATRSEQQQNTRRMTHARLDLMTDSAISILAQIRLLRQLRADFTADDIAA